jgi:hypothetical protein
MIQARTFRGPAGLVAAIAGLLIPIGCYNTPIDVSDLSRGPAPLREPSPAKGENCCYEDSLEGHHIFQMYCAGCHNARPLAERPFSNYRNVAAHMRVRANLTGKEYAKLMAWLRRWHDVPPPGLHEEPAPRRFIYSQPIPELREQKNKTLPDLPSGPRPGVMDETSSGQPAIGNAPREGR